MTFSIPVALLATATALASLLLPQHPGVISGRATDETGQGVVGVQITLNTGCGTLTGPHGQFVLSSVEHGEYVLNAASPGFARFTDTIAVVSGDTLRVAIALVPAMTRQERDTARTRLLSILAPGPESPPSQQWWIHDCR